MLRVVRSLVSRRPTDKRTRRPLHALLVERIAALIERFPTFGSRRIWAMLRKEGRNVSRKTVYRVLKRTGWLVHQREITPRPRAKRRRSIAPASDMRWAMDLRHIDCGSDGWAHLAAVIDCHDRELIGYEFALRGRAREAEQALEQACIARFGTLRPQGATPTVRSDNGLIFQSKRFRAACSEYG